MKALFAAIAAWFREEARLATAETWAPTYSPLTSEDPKCAETLRRQAECRERMRRMKMGVLDGRVVSCSASTDVAATMRKARAIGVGPVRMVRKAAR